MLCVYDGFSQKFNDWLLKNLQTQNIWTKIVHCSSYCCRYCCAFLASEFLMVFIRESSYCFQRILAIAIMFVCLSICHIGGSVKNGAS